MNNNPYTLLNKTILVTGASSGIGRAIAISCSNLGATVLLLARNEERLQETLSSMEGLNHQIVSCDLNDREKIAQKVMDFPKLDGIVYCSGTLRTVPTKMIQREDMDYVYETNFFSVVHLNTLLLQQKKIQKAASIVFLSSIAAFDLSEAGNAIYSSSKAALSSYSKVLALELSRRKIRVNTLSPGIVKTNFLKHFSVDEEQFQEDEKKYPLGYGTPEDIAYAACYLLSNAARWVTGTELKLDGGVTLK